MVREFLIRFPRIVGMRYMVAAACGWEMWAILTHKGPTLSVLASRHRWLAPFLLIALSIHFYLMPLAEQDMIDMEGSQ
jgi:hypothetical protein